MLVERRKPHSQERRKNSSDQVTHAAETLPNVTTSAEKTPKPGKVLKEPKPEVSSFSSQYLIKKNGKGLVENTAHYRISALLSRRIYIFQHWLWQQVDWRVSVPQSFSLPTSTNDWQNNPDVAVRCCGMKSWRCTTLPKCPDSSLSSTAHHGSLPTPKTALLTTRFWAITKE